MEPPAPVPSAITSFIHSSNPAKESQTHEPYYHRLALQVLHNLRYQHDWTSLHIHTRSPLPASASKLLPTPLISGLPPQRIYIHPDEQVELLKLEKDRDGNREGGNGPKAEEEGLREREWVLPTHLREKWSLRRFADVFDGVGEIPPEPDGIEDELIIEDDTVDNHRAEHHKQGKRRGGKRVLLATVNADSTIVYYIVHEGIVKPRQN